MTEHLTRKDILQRLRDILPYLRERYGVERIAIYGSFAKGEARRGSDVDILVELTRPLGLDFVDLAHYLEDLLGRRVDLATFDQFQKSRHNPRYQHIVADIERTLVDVRAS